MLLKKGGIISLFINDFYLLFIKKYDIYYYSLLEETHPDYNDEKFGNIVYCGTANAVNDSGIKVVKVKV